MKYYRRIGLDFTKDDENVNSVLKRQFLILCQTWVSRDSKPQHCGSQQHALFPCATCPLRNKKQFKNKYETGFLAL